MTDAAHPQPSKPALLPPRRAQVRLHDSELRSMLGLKPDETIHAVQYHAKTGAVDVVIDSPRLRPVGYFMNVAGQAEPAYQLAPDSEPPYVRLPLADHYEPQDDKPYPGLLTYPVQDGFVSVPLTREDGALRPARDLEELGLSEEQRQHVREVCERYSLVQS